MPDLKEELVYTLWLDCVCVRGGDHFKSTLSFLF